MEKQRYQLWYAHFPFSEDKSIFKVRPVILDHKDSAGNWVCIYVTSQEAKFERHEDYWIKQWEEIGLEKESRVRTTKQATLSDSNFVDFIGVLKPFDIVNLKKLGVFR